MPDQSQITQVNGNSLDSLESLIQEAEQQATTSVVDHPKPCLHTFDADTHQKCPTCLWSFCTLDASSLDPRYCRLCLTEPDAELRESPLIDTDGVTHEGRVLTPAPSATFFQPRFGTLAKTISEMSDSELDDYVAQYKDLVRQAEKALDFRRVVLGASQLEQAQRGDIRRRKLQADKTKFPIRTISIDKATGKQVTKTASAAGMTQMLQMLEALQKMKEIKKV